MHTYRVEVYDRAGALLLGARMRCHDDGHALARLNDLPLPAGKVLLLCGQRRVGEFVRPLA